MPLAKVLPSVSRASLPDPARLSARAERIAGSDRYILGPAYLERFEPRIPGQAAAFHLSSEAATARYRTSAGEMQLTLFMFQTPQMARERLPEFQKIAGADRAEVGTPDGGRVACAGRRARGELRQRCRVLLDKIEYRPEFMWTEEVPRYENPGKMILAIFDLAGICIGACAAAGVDSPASVSSVPGLAGQLLEPRFRNSTLGKNKGNILSHLEGFQPPPPAESAPFFHRLQMPQWTISLL